MCRYFDLQAHRGGRGEVVEAVLPTFADALKTGVTTLEFDVGLTKDGHLIVWHDEVIVAEKCQDTAAAFAGDEMFPYVGQNVANLTLAQVKTLGASLPSRDLRPHQSIADPLSHLFLQTAAAFVSLDIRSR